MSKIKLEGSAQERAGIVGELREKSGKRKWRRSSLTLKISRSSERQRIGEGKKMSGRAGGGEVGG